MSANLNDYIGKPVDIWSVRGQSEIKDSGVLQNVDERWVVIQQGSELLFFPIARIRLVKLQ